MMYLYVKTHTVTGLKYLGKTVKGDYHRYAGSGKRWLAHLKEHGFTYTTEILLATENKEELRQTGMFFSKLWNIVYSNDWANLCVEEGSGGTTPSSLVKTEQHKKNISRSLRSEKTNRRLRENNWAVKNPEAHREHVKKIGRKKGDIVSEETRCKISSSVHNYLSTIDVHPNRGRVRDKVMCPHCNKQGAFNVMSRFHFDNCKYRGSGANPDGESKNNR